MKIKVKVNEIRPKEYAIVSTKEEIFFYSKNLGSDILFTVFSADLQKSAIGRQLEKERLEEMFSKLLSDKTNSKSFGKINISIMGGNLSKASEKYAETLIENLVNIQNKNSDYEIIVKSFDVGVKFHPENISFCSSNGIVSAGIVREDLTYDH